jgi:uncharacterized protein (TIGR02217 family)
VSNQVYPTLPGLDFGVTRTPTWKTDVKTTPSGREFRGAQMTSALYTYTLVYEFLRDTSVYPEMRTLMGFFNARQGSFDSFLFNDPDDNTATLSLFGTGDGVTTAFQLLRTLGGTAEPVYDLNGTATILVNGTPRALGTDYSINTTGGVTFNVAPPLGSPVTWTGAYYWRVRFTDDTLELGKFMATFWEAKKVTFITVKP